MKTALKTLVFGRETRPYRVRCGVARGIRYWLNPTCDSQRILGTAEHEIGHHVRTWFQKARCVVDVGAGAGWYSLVALELNPSAQVVAIEPDGLARANLEANLHLNGYCQGERITVLDQAVSPDGLSLERVLAPFTGPVAIKMDIEGGEFEALHSAGHALRRPGIALIVETHSRELEQACVAYVQELGFHTRVIRPAPWRILLPERRPIEHNRWFVAWDSTIESGVRCSENES